MQFACVHLLGSNLDPSRDPKTTKNCPKTMQEIIPKTDSKMNAKMVPKRPQKRPFSEGCWKLFFDMVSDLAPRAPGDPLLMQKLLPTGFGNSKIDATCSKMLPMQPEWYRKDSQAASGTSRTDAQTPQNDSKDPPGNKKMPTSTQPPSVWLPKTSASECELSFRSRFSVLA